MRGASTPRSIMIDAIQRTTTELLTIILILEQVSSDLGKPLKQNKHEGSRFYLMHR
jgi:hypothetical protein